MTAPPGPAVAGAGAETSVFERGGWRFEARVRPLWNSNAIDDLARDSKLCKVPDMFCGDALFRAFHASSSTVLELSTADALRCCAWKPPPPSFLHPPLSSEGDSGEGTGTESVVGTGPNANLLGTVQCQFAGRWRPHMTNSDVKELEVTSDWTCSTPYWGSIYRLAAGARGDGAMVDGDLLAEDEAEVTEEALPWDLLRRRDEILWYQEVLFWEDELADNGLCRVNVRVRAMPGFWFALLLCEVRVDNVLLREVATRFFCDFNSDNVVREWTWKEATYEALQKRGVNLVDNPHISGTSIGTSLLGQDDVRHQFRHKIRIKGGSAGIKQSVLPVRESTETATAEPVSAASVATGAGTQAEVSAPTSGGATTDQG
eukprot:TRINITY_DN67651_c0_g1_i1.p1 TRINITY_DN67651_c0_g1~~TRINITY_DN67651_c0_g1_i1.p1  ORF type:complete len:373 (-),score=60.53 TRINITY_DN67651_c0_g1_i1:99-1217(-)